MKVRVQEWSVDGWSEPAEWTITRYNKKSVIATDGKGTSCRFSMRNGDGCGSGGGWRRVFDDDVLMLRAGKPLDLNVHPMADVLRRVLAGMGEARDAIVGDPKVARRAIADEAIRSADAVDVVLVECATWALAGLAALAAKKVGA